MKDAAHRKSVTTVAVRKDRRVYKRAASNREAALEAASVVSSRAVIAARAHKLGLPVPEYLRRRALKWRAKELGLVYWPALFWRPAEGRQWIDPAAFVAAEKVMAKVIGSHWGDKLPYGGRSNGGWDAAGHYGLEPQYIANYWLKCGCKSTRKFRAIVAANASLERPSGPAPIPSRDMTYPQTRNFIRGWRWIYSSRSPSGFARPQAGLHRLVWSRKALIALGRLSPAMRAVAVASLRGSEARLKPVRVRDLDWAAVAAMQRALAAASMDRRPIILAAAAGCVARAAMYLDLPRYVDEDKVVEAMTPQYKFVRYNVAADLILGRDPARGALTKAERHAWLSEGAPELAGWLADRLGVPAHRSVRVVRWLAHCRASGRWAALERVRTTPIPGTAEVREWAALDVLDEIQDEDIHTGKDSVDAVLRRAAERLGDAWLSRAMQDHRPPAPLPAWAHKLPKRLRLLRTPAALAKEGKEMQHCVGGYTLAVERGQCHILALSSFDGRSTIELSPDFKVRQHYGPRNTDPPRYHAKYIKAWLERIQR